MNDIEENFVNAIINKMEDRIGRKLSQNEIEILSKKRSLIAYEMILDYISDENLSKHEVKEYLNSLMK